MSNKIVDAIKNSICEFKSDLGYKLTGEQHKDDIENAIAALLEVTGDEKNTAELLKKHWNIEFSVAWDWLETYKRNNN